jgi:hypothetical protein
MGEGLTNKQQMQEGAKALGTSALATAGGVIGAPALAAGIAAAAPVVSRIARKAVPYIAPALGSYAISKARQLPVVGPVINHIPFAEMLPWMVSGKGNPEGEAAESEAAMSGATDQIPGRPYQANPRYQPRPVPAEIPPRKGPLLLGGEVEKIPDSAALGKIPASASEPATTGRQGTELLPSSPGPVMQRIPRPGSPGSKADTLETRSIQEQMREAGEAEDRQRLSQNKKEWFARNQPGSTKGELTGTADTPVKFSKTPGVKIPAAPKPGTVVPGPDQDLTDLLQRSVKAAKKAKD